jgi:hypothetical protein
VRNKAIEDTILNLKHPPGRKVPENEKLRSDWYNYLSETDRNWVDSVIASSVHEALFGLFTILDGDRNIEDGVSGGYFELIYVQSDRVLLNDPEKIGLHDLFNLDRTMGEK